MWGIWCKDINDWLREMPSGVDDGGAAILAFTSKREACRRAGKHYHFGSYTEAKKNDWCEVRKLPHKT